MPPVDALRLVFTDDVIADLFSITSPTDLLRARLDVLTATGSTALDASALDRLTWLRAQKAAWELYLEAAFSYGLFDGESGNDLRARLTGADDDNFRSGIAECMSCWFLAGRLKLPVQTRPTGRDRRVLDLCVRSRDVDVHVEVKAPYAMMPTATVWSGDNSHRLAQAVDEANKQFTTGRPNVLLIVTNSNNPLFGGRDELVRAFFGDEKLTITFNRQTLEVVDQRVVFAPDGRFLRVWDRGKPRFTRTSAVVRLREKFVTSREGHQSWMEPKWVVLHNPHCPHPVPTEMWGDCPQFVADGEVMRWTDGKPTFG